MTWEEALAALGSREAWEPPSDLGPLPAALASRAREILAGLGREIEAVEASMATVRVEIAELAGAASAEPGVPQFIDAKA